MGYPIRSVRQHGVIPLRGLGRFSVICTHLRTSSQLYNVKKRAPAGCKSYYYIQMFQPWNHQSNNFFECPVMVCIVIDITHPITKNANESWGAVCTNKNIPISPNTMIISADKNLPLCIINPSPAISTNSQLLVASVFVPRNYFRSI